MSATESVERDPDGSRAAEPVLAVDAAAAAARRYLLSIQREDGHWCAELEGDTILESEYMLTLHFLGRAGETRFRKAAEYLRRQQLPPAAGPSIREARRRSAPRPRRTSR